MVRVTPYVPPINVHDNAVFFEFAENALMKCFRYPKMRKDPKSAYLYSSMKVNYEMLVKADGFILLLTHDRFLYTHEFGEATPLYSLPRRSVTTEAITGIRLELSEFGSGGNFDHTLKKNLESKNPELMKLIRDHKLQGSDRYYTERNIDHWCVKYNNGIQRQIYDFVRRQLLTHIDALKVRGWIEGRVELPELQVQGYVPY